MTERSVKAIVCLIWGFILYFFINFCFVFCAWAFQTTEQVVSLDWLVFCMCVSVSDRVECGHVCENVGRI